MVTRRGATNTNVRGNSRDRAKRKLWLLAHFGNGISAPCFSCGRAVLFSTMEVDKVIPQALGGRYVRGNIRPSCGDCNRRAGIEVQRHLRSGTPHEILMAMCLEGVL